MTVLYTFFMNPIFPAGRRALSLTGRINLAVILTLFVGLGLVSTLFTTSLVNTRHTLVDSNLQREADVLYTSIESFMLPGEAPIAASFFDDVSNLGTGYTLALYRRDGTLAFSDDTTIGKVNELLGRQRFVPRGQPGGADGVPSVDTSGAFSLAVAVPPESIYVTENEGGRTYKRVYRPLINLPRCTVCHGGDHTIRGVLDIRTDISASVRAEALTIAGSGLGFIVMVSVIALILGRMMRVIVVLPVQEIGRVCSAVTGGNFSGRVDIRSSDEIGRLADTVNEMVHGLHERYELTKYVSGTTISSLASGQEPKRVERTLLFSDVRGFTAYTERHGAEAILSVLNQMLHMQSVIIHHQGGDVDKFVGDEVVSVFSGDDAPLRAVRAAMKIQAMVRQRAADYDNLAIGMGIATGSVVQGMVGSETRADFTVLGDAVNVASRLCSIAKPGQILVCETTGAHIPAETVTLDGPYRAKLKGKAEPRKVFIVRLQEGTS